MTATINVAPANAQPKTATWAPDHDDHFIYWWVKLEGNTQSYVAGQLGVSQGTISRTIKRYERWQTRAEAAADGRLNHAEKLRAQKWLTYERNELILASCLRIAGEMESCFDASKSTYLRQLASNQIGHGTEIRTEQHAVDRHGIACRFLRLAHRINMEQQKLVEQAELEPLPPLTAEQIAEEEASALATRQELRRARQAASQRVAEMRQTQAPPAATDQAQRQADVERLKQIEEAERLALAEEILARQREEEAGDRGQETGDRGQIAAQQDAGAHIAHNDEPQEPGATDDEPSTCGENGRPKKNSRYARMNGSATSRRQSRVAASRRNRGAPAVAELRLSPERTAIVQTE